jgi:dihydropteroate synthase
MHMRGEPENMQQLTDYDDLLGDICHYLLERVEACTKLGVARRNIVLDPGFGFSKTADQNLTLLNRLPQLVALGFPVLVGLSRKSLIGHVLGRAVDERLAGSLALAAIALQKGALIVRVHDVKETMDVVRLWTAVAKA